MNLKSYLQKIFSFTVRRKIKVDLPYIYRAATTHEPPQLEVKYPCAEAASVGYAEAIRLPYEIAGVAWDYPQGTLVVHLNSWNETIVTGYANAIDLPRDQRGFHNECVCAPSGASISKPNVEVISENLDKFLQIDSEYEGALDYQTTHGLRSVKSERPEHNQFLVTKKGDGFARPKDLPYVYFPAKEGYPSQLIVQHVCAEASEAGYVRGYRQDLLLTDNGAFASAEVRLPVLRVADWKAVLQVAPFVDLGSTWNSGRSSPDTNSLASVGLGLVWQQSDRFTARLDYGIPLVSVDSTERTWQENGLYFSVFYNPF